MKKRFLVLLLSLAVCLGLTGCIGSYNPATGGGSRPGQSNPGNDETNGDPFTVTLACGDERFIPSETITAQWSNGDSLFTADFDGSTASVAGPDGNYKVTLSKAPEGYVYDPNIYVATNKERDVIIQLYELNKTKNNGTGWGINELISIHDYNREGGANNGYYAAKFTSRNQKIYYRFSADRNGTYSIESLMDTTANNINPRLDYYGQNAHWTPDSPMDTCNTGGATAAYTKNFKFEVSLYEDCVNFVLRCDSRIEYPVTVYFKVTWLDEYSRDYALKLKIPEKLYGDNGEVIKSQDYGNEYSYVKYGRENGNTSHILYGDRVELGEDGYWHNKEDGSLVYVDLSEILRGRLNQSEGPNGEVTSYYDKRIPIAPYDYTYFIMGWQGLMEVYKSSIPEDYYQYENGEGYSSSANSDGRVAVTDELKDFLLLYCREHRYFFDGYGSAEGAGYNASDDDQWMYFCGFYAKN